MLFFFTLHTAFTVPSNSRCPSRSVSLHLHLEHGLFANGSGFLICSHICVHISGASHQSILMELFRIMSMNHIPMKFLIEWLVNYTYLLLIGFCCALTKNELFIFAFIKLCTPITSFGEHRLITLSTKWHELSLN